MSSIFYIGMFSNMNLNILIDLFIRFVYLNGHLYSINLLFFYWVFVYVFQRISPHHVGFAIYDYMVICSIIL